jgi:hypothetical protein
MCRQPLDCFRSLLQRRLKAESGLVTDDRQLVLPRGSIPLVFRVHLFQWSIDAVMDAVRSYALLSSDHLRSNGG